MTNLQKKPLKLSDLEPDEVAFLMKIRNAKDPAAAMNIAMNVFSHNCKEEYGND